MDHIIREPREALQVFDHKPSLAIDLETSALKSWQGGIMCYNIADGEGNVAVIHTPGGGMPEEIDILLRRPREWITHNGTNFDLHFLQSYGHMPEGTHFDTLVGEQVLATTGRADVKKDLASSAKRRLGLDVKQQVDHTAWSNPELTEHQVMYCAMDVLSLHALQLRQLELAVERRLDTAMMREMDLTRCIARIGYNGLQLDEDKLDELIIEQYERALEAQSRIGVFFNPNSPKQVMEYLHSIGCMVTDTKAGTLNLLADDWPQIEDVLIMRRARKRTSMYEERMATEFADGDGIVRTNYWQVGTDTTRFSCSNPNLQQIPRNFRAMFGGKEGHQVVAVDYSQLELRVAAEIAQDYELMKALEAEDLHSDMAYTMFNRPHESVEERNGGKAGTYTWVFKGGKDGVQAMGAAQGIRISDQMANMMLRNLSRRFTGVAKWHRQCEQASHQRTVSLTLPWGHKRHLIGAMRNPQRICNTMVQGSAAMGLKEAIFECEEQGILHLIGGLVHDEIVGTNIPDNEVSDFEATLKDCMIKGMQKVIHTVPIEVESKIGTHWKS